MTGVRGGTGGAKSSENRDTVRERKTRWQALALIMVLRLIPSLGQAASCDDLSANPADYKVLLDEFSVTPADAKGKQDLIGLYDELQFSVSGHLAVLGASAKKVNHDEVLPISYVFCQGQSGTFDESDLTDDRAERLTDELVVVEIRGTIALRTTGAGTTETTANVGYWMPPLRHYHRKNLAARMHVVPYPRLNRPPSIAELVRLPEFPAFALIGLGTRAWKGKKYDLALWAFKRARDDLNNAKLDGPRVEALKKYVDHAVCEADSHRNATSQGRNEWRNGGVGIVNTARAPSCEDAP